jgi:hypothetical protein
MTRAFPAAAHASSQTSKTLTRVSVESAAAEMRRARANNVYCHLATQSLATHTITTRLLHHLVER